MSDFRGSSNTEDEYFAREDAEKKRKLALQVKRETQAAERARLKALHWMRCPKCGMEMQALKMRGVDVDVCFGCNGIFLDQKDLEHFEKHPGGAVMRAFLNWLDTEKKK